jgi:hypothetical protein
VDYGSFFSFINHFVTELRHKDIVIVHNWQEVLMNNSYRDKWSRGLDRQIRKQGIKNEFIDDLMIEGRLVKARHGESLVADPVVSNVDITFRRSKSRRGFA